MHCDLCGSDSHEDVYRPIGTRREAAVCVCNRCGLVFTRYGNDNRNREPTPSGDADWGNIRYAKGFRLDALKPLMVDKVRAAKRILDVGSNRGDFLRWAAQDNPEADLFGIESDERLTTDDYPEFAEYTKDKMSLVSKIKR